MLVKWDSPLDDANVIAVVAGGHRIPMISCTPKKDRDLSTRLQKLTHQNRDYWSFESSTRRKNNHGLFQYPAMTVPDLPGVVLDQIAAVHPEARRIFDPFAGSGTVLTESMSRGLSFVGADINPLAILLCRVKAGPFMMEELAERSARALERAECDKRAAVEVDFPNIGKWFTHGVQVSLSRIRRAIVKEEEGWARRFLWVGLAEAARLTSNSRTSTFKLHTRTKSDLDGRTCDPMLIFGKAISRNLKHMKDHAESLNRSGFLHRGSYVGQIRLALGDTRKLRQRLLADVLMTSPPYGDNPSTVPYGQYSYLPLQWLDLSDIDEGALPEYLRTTHEIDARSLGGSTRGALAKSNLISQVSPAFEKYIRLLSGEPHDRSARIIAFVSDLNACIEPLLAQMRPGGLLVWIVGNRMVGGRRLPLDEILTELLASHQVRLVFRSSRRIPSKRMANKNNITDTMSREAILVMRKAI